MSPSAPTPAPGLNPRRVVVAMSGGVDSTVAAALLQQRGFDVVGVTLALDGGAPAHPGPSPAELAAEAAAALGAEHRVVEGGEAFRERVLRAAWEDYAAGRTPSPCTVCNPRVKFSLLSDQARRLGAGRIATGHHARLERGPDGRPRLLRGVDRHKDQSYFLFALSPEQLGAALFPVGHLTKAEVRQQARARGLPNAAAPESQDSCWGDDPDGFAESLRRLFGAEVHPGPFLERGGGVLGQHQGIHRYTVGQRRGLGLALGRRAYVVGLCPGQNAVEVSTDPDALLASGLLAGDERWLADPPPPGRPLALEAQIRYRSPPRPATLIRNESGGFSLRFAAPRRAITPGQAVVLYRGEQVLGGGWIRRAESPPDRV